MDEKPQTAQILQGALIFSLFSSVQNRLKKAFKGLHKNHLLVLVYSVTASNFLQSFVLNKPVWLKSNTPNFETWFNPQNNLQLLQSISFYKGAYQGDLALVAE